MWRSPCWSDSRCCVRGAFLQLGRDTIFIIGRVGTVCKEVAHVEPILLVPGEPGTVSSVPARQLTCPDILHVGDHAKIIPIIIPEAIGIGPVAGIIYPWQGAGQSKRKEEEQKIMGEHPEVLR